MSVDGRLGLEERAAALRRMASETFDAVVIGGGVTGCGTALDAASRGLRVALLEARDLAGGTSSRSGKTFHGGLRYLERGNLSLVRSALRERDLMVERLCPHLARPVPFLLPLTSRWERAYMGAGVLLYDLLGGARRGIPGHRHLSRTGAHREMPGLRADVRGAIQYHDVRVDDARHTLALARTAARHGCAVLTRAEVVGMLRDQGRVTGVRAVERESGEEIAVRARSVINATGVWADRVQALAGEVRIEVRPAKGIHVVVPRERIASRTGLIARSGDSVLVIRPWWRHWIIGTTDTRWDHAREEPAASGADVDYLLVSANRWLREPLRRDDVVGVFAGLRPLLSGRAEVTAALSRDHAVVETAPGLVTVVGGKYTTYRVMAAEAVDAATYGLSQPVPRSCTADVQLIGADGFAAVRNRAEDLAAEAGLGAHWGLHLLDRHGSAMTEVLDLVAERPELGRPLEGAPGYLEAEVVYAATHEAALGLDDVLERRTHAAWETADRGLAAAERSAQLLAETLGWSEGRRAEELTRHSARVAAVRRAEAAPDDAAAVAAREQVLAGPAAVGGAG